ncbi:MAG: RluA family pseudouridine synthase [Acidobacteria bacterium]|nr:RluA family pseudouridine synthase [Acidobacteriota bacterium]
MTQRIEIVVPTEIVRMRLDEFLFRHFGGLSKMYLRNVVRDEKCEVNGRNENLGYKLRSGDLIEIELDLTRETAMQPQEMPLDIVYEDSDLLVVNKAAGMLVHPNNRDKNGTLLNALSFYLNRETTYGNGSEPAIRPGLVHRLDKDTSGLMVISKNTNAQKKLMKSFSRKFVHKRYLALVDGIVAQDVGVIDLAVGRFAERKIWDVKETGKPAETRYEVLERRSGRTLLKLEPVTGRTNQLRIHCAAIGHPITGDIQRGGSEHERLCLHAAELGFRHPATRENVIFYSEPEGFAM